MTGLWQVAGRSNLGFDDLVRLDFYYLENWSIWLDVSILLKTIPAVFARRGAYQEVAVRADVLGEASAGMGELASVDPLWAIPPDPSGAAGAGSCRSSSIPVKRRSPRY